MMHARNCFFMASRIKNKEDQNVLAKMIQVSVEAMKKSHEQIEEMKDFRITSLEGLLDDVPKSYDQFFFAGGMLAGIVTSILIFYASVKVQG